MSLPDWARAFGGPLFTAAIRTQPEDFEVVEDLGWEFTGDGEHDYLWIEKTGANTEWVARQLAKHAGVPAKDVGFSGLKDRYAVTWQWFSVPRRHSPDWRLFDVEGVCVADVQHHNRKLRRGAHRSNRFRIVMRCTGPADTDEISARIDRIRKQGVPNYFGEQRFGRGGANLALADQWASGARLPRHKRSIAISTVRSFCLNQTLHERVEAGTWNRLLPGDKANLAGSGSVFDVSDVDDELERRCREMDIHPAGELPGEGSNIGNTRWQEALDGARVKPGWRSLRLTVQDLDVRVASDAVMLTFSLGRGAFATSVLREIADTSQPV
ncbi:MAG: tRNA pseudouridine(13) synthase TruD [Woeseiaceae bacterium]|nr:tRNA pseudouridine(13) synthase TruD [Woeseiaceae bacterium]